MTAGFGTVLVVLGVIFFDGLVAIGNALLVAGLACWYGFDSTYSHFFQEGSLKATGIIFGGFCVVLIGLSRLGIALQIFGFVLSLWDTIWGKLLLLQPVLDFLRKHLLIVVTFIGLTLLLFVGWLSSGVKSLFKNTVGKAWSWLGYGAMGIGAIGLGAIGLGGLGFGGLGLGGLSGLGTFSAVGIGLIGSGLLLRQLYQRASRYFRSETSADPTVNILPSEEIQPNVEGPLNEERPLDEELHMNAIWGFFVGGIVVGMIGWTAIVITVALIGLVVIVREFFPRAKDLLQSVSVVSSILNIPWIAMIPFIAGLALVIGLQRAFRFLF